MLRVKVIAIDSTPVRYDPAYMYYRATVRVLDTLKGRFIPPSRRKSGQDHAQGDTNAAGHSSGDVYTDITFHGFIDYGATRSYFEQFAAHDPAFSSVIENVPVDSKAEQYYAEERAFTGSTAAFSMRIGQEAVVFLTYRDWLADSTHDYFELGIEPKASLGALPIIDGKVRDLNRVWSDDIVIDYGAWRRRFFAIRDKILNGTY